MRKLLFKLLLVFIICTTIITIILNVYGGYVDFFYEKFTTPKTKSMIIGDSRSFQGIQPTVIDDYFKDSNLNLPILNYSFTGAQAISGPLYNASIQKKLDSAATDGLFIISITPDFLTSKEGFDNYLGEFREAGQPPHNMVFVDNSPNYEYLIKNLNFFHFKALFRKSSRTHKNGWLEESNLPKDTLIFNEWKQNQIEVFLEDRDKYKLSQLRINSLDTLIGLLKTHGKVCLVRMPIDKEYLFYEKKYYPELDNIVDSISMKQGVKYFNFIEKENIYGTYDGHHLDKNSGKIFTKALCDSISKYYN